MHDTIPILYYTVLYFILVCYTILPYSTLLQYAILYHTVLCYAMLYQALCEPYGRLMLSYATLGYAIPYKTMVCSTRLCPTPKNTI